MRERQESEDEAYRSDPESEEEKQEFNNRKQQIEYTDFDGSDNMAYEEDPDEEEFDEFEMSQDSEEERNRAFYGDDYTLLSATEKQSQQAAMSMTMQQRD